MDLATALRTRRSIRSFKPDPVPRDLVQDLLDQARWSPSWANSQCWRVFVVTGAALERLRAVQGRLDAQGTAPRPDFRFPDRTCWTPAMQAQNKALVQLLSEARASEPSADPSGGRTFFGAPCLLLVAVDRRQVPDYALFDTGLFVQSLCLAAHDRGLGTCIQAMAVRHPDLLRQELPGAADLAFVAGIALGYPRDEAPVNAFQRPRADLEALVAWVDEPDPPSGS